MAVPHSMRHQFERVLIPAGEISVQETCKICGQKRIRYANGNATYIKSNGSRSPFGRKPCISPEVPQQTNDVQLIQLQPLPAIYAETDRIVATKKFGRQMTQDDAIMKDALMIIKLMYEDLVIHNVASKSREMAGRFLYSQRYEEVVKAIESKTKNY